MKNFFMAALAAWLILLGLPVLALAQEQPKQSITISPATTKPNVKAGETYRDSFTVLNSGKEDYTFLVYARPFSVSGENYNPDYTTINERTEAYQWVQFQQSKFELKAGSNVEIPYSLQIPKDARAGGHYAVLFAETQPPEPLTSGVQAKKRVGMLLYVNVDGTIKQSGVLEGLESKFWQQIKPINSLVRIKNTGNTHFEANLDFRYKNVFGGGTAYEDSRPLEILPGTTRAVPISWQGAPYLGVYKTGGTVKFLNQTETIPEKYVLVLPIGAIISIISIAFLAVVIVVAVKRRYKKQYPRLSDRR